MDMTNLRPIFHDLFFFSSSSPPAMVASVVPTEVAEQVLMTGLMSEPSENGSKSGSPTDTTEPQPDTDTIKMFVGQVPRTMDENELRGMFEEFGPVYQINVLRDKITGQSKGKRRIHVKITHNFLCPYSRGTR